MSAVRPPRLAAWLLRSLGPTDQDPLIGDLLEEYAHRQSAAWFWRETLAAIVLGAWREIRGNKLRAVGALFVGWLALEACALLTVRLFFTDPLTITMFSWRRLTLQAFLLIVSLCMAGAVSGWVVSRITSSPRLLVAFTGTLFSVALFALVVNTYVILGRADFERAIYWETLPTSLVVSFVAMPLSVLLGGAARRITRAPIA